MLENNSQFNPSEPRPRPQLNRLPTPAKGDKGQLEWRKRHTNSLLIIGRSNPLIPALLFGPMIIFLIGYSALEGTLGIARGIGLYSLGVFAWTLLEYVLHRFSFHTSADPAAKSWNPVRWLNALSSGVHGLHHDQPRLPDLIVAPPTLSFPSALLYLWLGYLATGSLAVSGMFFAGLSSAYLFYEWVHYSTHCRRPRTRIGRYLTKYHMVHHFTDSGNYFGVTSPLWDIVFRTMPRSIKMK